MIVSVLLMLVRLRFDGSFRDWATSINQLQLGALHPIIHRRFAGCAASIEICSTNCPHGEKVYDERFSPLDGSVVAVGGKRLHPDSIRTSAQAEYEGLLLGLDMLIELLPVILLRAFHDSGDDSMQSMRLVIQGDCKTVLHQLQGRSRARALEAYADMALQRLEIVQRKLSLQSHGSVDESTVAIEHIPRQYNSLCDAVANVIVEQELQAAEHQALGELPPLQASSNPTTEASVRASSTTSTSALPPIILSRSGLLHNGLHRDGIYERLAERAWRQGDWNTLHALGRSVEQELKPSSRRRMSSSLRPIQQGHNLGDAGSSYLSVACLTWQIHALFHMGRHREYSIARHAYNRLHATLGATLRSEFVVDRPGTELELGTPNDLTTPERSPSASPTDRNHERRNNHVGDTTLDFSLVDEWTQRALEAPEWQSLGSFVLYPLR